MSRSKGGMTSLLYKMLVLAALQMSICNAGPLGALPNVTNADLGLTEGSCALGDVVYKSGDDLPGGGPCERCTCSSGDVRCTKQRCEPRPGCKALHRPDHCCPTYQCDCEQEGRVYANGEKLVDPDDPCRVCYCQGGEVVCRRIACFVRDDCRPRLVPGRCCPEYDNCPLRGVTSLPGLSSSMLSLPPVEEISVNPASSPSASKEPIKQVITIKEITPVSEIPIITDVKIKEIMPSFETEDIQYTSSKSPLIPREATSEKSPSNSDSLSASPTAKESSLESLSTAVNIPSDLKSSNDSPVLAKDATESEMFPSRIPSIIIPLMGSPSSPDITPLTTKAPLLDDDEPPFDHNPAFPPIPDDLSVIHDDENIPEQNMDNEQVPNENEAENVLNVHGTTNAPSFKGTPSVTTSSESTSLSTEISTSDTNINKDIFISTESAVSRNSSMINLRSVIPKEILDVPSLISNETTGELLDTTEPSITVSSEDQHNIPVSTTDSEIKVNDKDADAAEKPSEFMSSGEEDTTAIDNVEETTEITYLKNVNANDDELSSTSKLGDIIGQTEFSSIPIETRDQNPHEIKDNNDKTYSSTTDEPMLESLPTRQTTGSEIITLLPDTPVKVDRSYDYTETTEFTEFIVTPYYSEDSTNDAVEVIRVFPDGKETSAIEVRPTNDKNNVLSELIKLVGDVAAIPDQNEKSGSENQPSTQGLPLNSNSEELIPVNARYKSKNNNWNLNSITEVPFKNKNSISVNKQRVIEIEDDDSDNITDSPPPYDKVEPTTRRPIIDNVSDTTSDNKTDNKDKKDIEIITPSYVPTVNRHPTKVVMKDEAMSQSDEWATATNTSAENVTSSIQTTVAPNQDESSYTQRIENQDTEHISTVSQ